jgi:hypothetical protein
MLVTRTTYAKLCGCSYANITARIEDKLISLKIKKLPDGTEGEYIDTVKYPPFRIRKKGGGRKKLKKNK